MIVHPRKEDDPSELGISSIFGSAKSTQEADNVVIMQAQQNKKHLQVRVAHQICPVRFVSYSLYYYVLLLIVLYYVISHVCQVVKNRFSGDLGVVPLFFDKETVSFYHRTNDPTKERPNDSIKENRKRK